MGKTIAVYNQKGGVGKTATINNLAYELNDRGKRVLMVDCDQQENLPISVGVFPRQLNCTIYDILLAEIEDRPYKKDLSDAIVHAPLGVDLISGSVAMASMDKNLFEVSEHKTRLDRFLEDYQNDYALQEKVENAELSDNVDWFIRLKAGYESAKAELLLELCKAGLMTDKDGDLIIRKVLSSVKAKYDYILIDCPPALSALTENILNAADRVIVPMTLEPFSATGLTHLITTIDTIRKGKNPKVKFSGLLYTMANENLTLSKEIKEEAKIYGQFLYIYKTTIPRSTEVNKAFAATMPLIEYNKNNAARLAYSAFCDEFLEREE